MKPDFCWGGKQTKDIPTKFRTIRSHHCFLHRVKLVESFLELCVLELHHGGHDGLDVDPALVQAHPAPRPRLVLTGGAGASVRLSAELLPFFYREIAYLAQGNLCKCPSNEPCGKWGFIQFPKQGAYIKLRRQSSCCIESTQQKAHRQMFFYNYSIHICNIFENLILGWESFLNRKSCNTFINTKALYLYLYLWAGWLNVRESGN